MTPDALRTARIDAGLRQADVGRMVNRTAARVCQMERGGHWQPDLAERMAAAIEAAKYARLAAKFAKMERDAAALLVASERRI